MNGERRQRETLLQQPVGLHHQVLLGCSIHGNTGLREGELFGGNNLQRILYRDGVEHRLQVVIAVGPLADDVQP